MAEPTRDEKAALTRAGREEMADQAERFDKAMEKVSPPEADIQPDDPEPQTKAERVTAKHRRDSAPEERPYAEAVTDEHLEVLRRHGQEPVGATERPVPQA